MSIFLSLEGNDGAGKSGQARTLADRLSRLGIPTVLTREPGGSPQSEDIRNLLVRGDTDRWSPMTEILLFTAARLEHLNRTIRPALAENKVVICDRYIDSTLAYQGAAHDMSRDLIMSTHRDFCGGQMPDLTVILDIEPAVGLARSTKRLKESASGEDRFEAHDLSFHEKVRASFLSTAFDMSRTAIVIDATPDFETVSDRIFDVFLTAYLHKLGCEDTTLDKKMTPHGYNLLDKGENVGRILKCIDGESWSITLDNVDWHLSSSDPRNLTHPDGIVKTCYAHNLATAFGIARYANALMKKQDTSIILDCPAP